MGWTISAATQQLAQLIDMHLGDLCVKQPAWLLADSPIVGRGLFATRDIKPGEEILRERALLVGPLANKNCKLNYCSLCYCQLEGADEDILCSAGCGLPVCAACKQTPRHDLDCQLLSKWQPKETKKITQHTLRVLSTVRCLFLKPWQRDLLLSLQANADQYYMRELQSAANCFEHFPQQPEVLEYFHHTLRAFNTNAFEGRCKVQGVEVSTRGLFPLSGLMNHECTPNAAHYFDTPDTIVVVATRAIAKDEEITSTYAKLLWSTLVRNVFLLMTKQFMCHCSRCLDPTENGTYLSALFCREKGCKGLVIPVQTKMLQPDWRCLTCENVFPHSKMARYQDFALNTINNRINISTVHDMIHFINEFCPRFCPPSNYVLIEAKLNVIWRMTRCKDEQYSADELQHCENYREEILEILRKLGAGECTLKKLITEGRESLNKCSTK